MNTAEQIQPEPIQVPTDEVFIGIAEVKRQSGLCRTTIWRMERRGEFPKRVQLTANRVGWSQREVNDWKAKRLEARQPKMDS